MAKNLCADVFVIGAGPAGLSAALALCRQLYRTIVFDSGVYRNSRSKHMHMVPTWDHRDAAEFRSATRKEILSRYDTTLFVDQKVDTLKKRDDGIFVATCDNGRSYTARRVIMATGVTDVLPSIKGYDRAWGSSIFHCLFCHGYEERGGDHAGVLGVEVMANKAYCLGTACMSKNLAKNVTIYTNGNTALAEELRPDTEPRGINVDSRNITELEKLPSGVSDIRIHFDDGSSHTLSYLQHMPKTVPNGPFAEQLGLELGPMGEYKVGAPMPETNLPGVLAAGDAGSAVKSVAGAISSGGMAAVAVVHSLSAEMPNKQ